MVVVLLVKLVQSSWNHKTLMEVNDDFKLYLRKQNGYRDPRVKERKNMVLKERVEHHNTQNVNYPRQAFICLFFLRIN